MDNRKYWNNRYAHEPTLGSGQGSRGLVRQYKQALLSKIARERQPRTTLDIGCGDMAVGEILPLQGYLGVDISEVVIEGNRSHHPGRRFVNGDFTELTLEPAELLVCLDVLIHLSDADYYRKFVEKLVGMSRKCGVVAGFDVPPHAPSEITFYHEPLSVTLARAGAVNIRPVGAYRQVTIFQFEAPQGMTASAMQSLQALRQPVYVVGAMRSGTTLLGDLLDLSPRLCLCPFELKDIWSQGSGVPMASPKTGDRCCPAQSAEDAQPWQAEKLSKAFLARMAARRDKAGGATFVNKNPHLCNKLPWVHALFPDARYIWIHRHMPQVVASLIRLFEDVRKRQGVVHVWPRPVYSTTYRCWEVYRDGQVPSDIPGDRIFPGGNVEWLAEYWLESNLAVRDFAAAGLAPIHEINQDRLIADPWGELTRCMAELELPMLPESVELPELHKERNSEWHARLDGHQVKVLCQFVERHAQQIDRAFPNEERSQLYLEWLGSR